MSNSTSFTLSTAFSPHSEADRSDLSQALYEVSEAIVAQYFAVSTLAVLMYDHLITLDKEAKYFWKTPQKSVDFVYFAIRFAGIFSAVGPLFYNMLSAHRSLCQVADWMANFSIWVIIISIDYILMVRVLSLYSENRRLLIFLKSLLLLEAIFKLVMVIYGDILQHDIAVNITSSVAICSNGVIPPWRLGLIDWLVPILYGTLLMILAIYRSKDYWNLSAGFKEFMLIKILIRDQVVYFILTVACSVFNILAFRLRIPVAFLSNVFQCLGNPSFLSILGTRLLFNLKDAGSRSQNVGTSTCMPSGVIGEIGFAGSTNSQSEMEVTVADA